MTYGMALAPEFFGPVGMALGFGGENLAASKMRGESNEQALEAGASGVGAGLAGGILGRLGFRAGTGVAKNFGEAAYRDFVENTPVGKWLYNLAVNRYGEGVGTRAVQAAGREVGLGGGFGYGGAAGANIAREGVPQSGEDVGRRVREIAGQGLGPAEQGAGMSLAILLARKLLTGRRGTPVGYGQRLRASPEELAGQAANKPTSIEARPQNEPGEQRMGAGQGAPKAGGEVTETPAGGDPNDPVVWQAPAVNGVPVQEVLSRADAQARVAQIKGSSIHELDTDAASGSEQAQAQAQNEPGATVPGAGAGAPKPGPTNTAVPGQGRMEAALGRLDRVAAADAAAARGGGPTEGGPRMVTQPGETIGGGPAPGTRASVPFMITRGMEGQLRAMGYTPEQINAMTPGQAHQALAGQQGAPPPPTAPPTPPGGGGNLPPFPSGQPAPEAPQADLTQMGRAAWLAAIRQRMADIDTNLAQYRQGVQREAAVRAGGGNLGQPPPPSRMAPAPGRGLPPTAPVDLGRMAPAEPAAAFTYAAPGNLPGPGAIWPPRVGFQQFTPEGNLPPMGGRWAGVPATGNLPSMGLIPSEQTAGLPPPGWTRDEALGYAPLYREGGAPPTPGVPPSIAPPPGQPPGPVGYGGEGGPQFLERLRQGLATAAANEKNLSPASRDAITQASQVANEIHQRWQSMLATHPHMVTQEMSGTQGAMLEQQMRLIEILPQLPQNVQDVLTGAAPGEFFAQGPEVAHVGALYRAFPDLLGIQQTENGVVLWNQNEVSQKVVESLIRHGQEANIREIYGQQAPVHETFLLPQPTEAAGAAPQTGARAAQTGAPTTQGAEVTEAAPGITLEVTGKGGKKGGGGAPPTPAAGGAPPTEGGAPPAAAPPMEGMSAEDVAKQYLGRQVTIPGKEGPRTATVVKAGSGKNAGKVQVWAGDKTQAGNNKYLHVAPGEIQSVAEPGPATPTPARTRPVGETIAARRTAPIRVEGPTSPTTTAPGGAAAPAAAPPPTPGAGEQAQTAQTTEQAHVPPTSAQPKISVSVSGKPTVTTPTAPAESEAKVVEATGTKRPFETAEDAARARGRWVEARDPERRLVLGKIHSATRDMVQISRGGGEKPVWVRATDIERLLAAPPKKGGGGPGEGGGGPSEGGAAPAPAVPDIVVQPPSGGGQAAALTAPTELTPAERTELETLRKQAAARAVPVEVEGGKPAAGPSATDLVKARRAPQTELRSMGQQLADLLQGKGEAKETPFGRVENPPAVYADIGGKWVRGYATGEVAQNKFRVRLENGTHEWLTRDRLAPGGKGPPPRPT